MDEPKGAESFKVIWDGKDDEGEDVASGIYFYQLTVRQAHRPEQSRVTVGERILTKKMLLLR